METYSVHFGFSQHFDFPAAEAFEWCTDYSPGDLDLMGNGGRRKVQRVNEDTFILTDEYGTKGESVLRTRRSKKVVRIYPERLGWTNTRVSSDGMYTQFLYQIVPEEGGSRLEYTGSQIFPGRRPGPKKLAEVARRLTAEDSASWRNLARAMAADLSK
ncbi:MAG: hypothetical protein ACLQEQ_00935 [Nitrososphaerales archaeon]